MLLLEYSCVVDVVTAAEIMLATHLQVEPDLRIESPGLCRALFEVYLGSNSVVPDAISVWAEGTRNLLESEEVRRSTRRGGSG